MTVDIQEKKQETKQAKKRKSFVPVELSTYYEKKEPKIKNEDKQPSKSIIVMDNAAFHKRKDIQELIHHSKHKLEYLPPYSPDLNPIEHKWAQLKSIRRKFTLDVDELFKFYS